jgi:multiple sugar transport system substrate-binding protein
MPIGDPADGRAARTGMSGSRRGVLKGFGALGAAGFAGLAMPTVLRAQARKLAFWTTQHAPAQVAAYEAIWKGFEAKNPGTQVAIEYLTEEEYLPKLSSALAAGAAPALMSHIPPEFAIVLDDKDLLMPMDDIINAVGEADFYENSLELLRNSSKGYYPALAIVNSTTTGPLWYRKDLFEKAGVRPPTNWTEMLAVANAVAGGGIFGTVYPFGKTSMGDKLFLQTLWQAGGTVLHPDLSVAFNSPQVVAALEFAKQVIALSPPSAATYSYTETINVFVQGRVGSAPYSGRVLVNIQDSKIADAVSVVAYPNPPVAEGGRKVYVGDFQSLVIPKATLDPAASKAMAMWLLQKDNYIKYLLAVPGHNLPNLKSIAASPEYLDNPLLQKYQPELKVLIDATAISRSLLRETPEHKTNVKAGAILNTRVMVEAVQDVVIGGVSAKDAAARGADKIAAIMKG